MKAQCKRFAGRTVVVGTTPFVFDGSGVCAVDPKGRGSAPKDFQQLLKMNGVTEVVEVEEALVEPETHTINEVSRHADTPVPLPDDAVMKPPAPPPIPKPLPGVPPPGVPDIVGTEKVEAEEKSSLKKSSTKKKTTRRRPAKKTDKGDS